MNASIETDIDIRPLRSQERDAFLELLSGWPFRDDRRGDEFFARSLDFDPRFQPDNVWVAARGEELLSCCQIFPRELRIAGEPVAAGGIGTVFTRPEARRQGYAGQVLAAATQEMQRRGLRLSMLHAGRLDWYERLGWTRWTPSTANLELAEGFERPRVLDTPLSLMRFDEDLHFETVQRLAASYSADRHGTVVRSAEDWRGSLRLAGNPVEEFVVGQDPRLDEPVVFLRGCIVEDAWQVLEWACVDGYQEHLAELFAMTLRTVGQEEVVAPLLQDETLAAELRRRGLVQQRPDPADAHWMLRCLAPEELAAQFAVPEELAQNGEALLRVLLPPPAFHFWTADRF